MEKCRASARRARWGAGTRQSLGIGDPKNFFCATFIWSHPICSREMTEVRIGKQMIKWVEVPKNFLWRNFLGLRNYMKNRFRIHLLHVPVEFYVGFFTIIHTSDPHLHPSVLIDYRKTHFWGDEKPKRGPLEIEIFLLRGVNERGWRGSGAFQQNPPWGLTKKVKIQNRGADNR